MASDDGAARVPLGPVGRYVISNLSLLRGRLSYRDLAARLTELGRPIPTLGLSRIEKGNRRVDADDLVALALALGVTPNRLLLPKGAGSDPVELTQAVTVSARRAWQWATGERYLDPGDEGAALVLPREADFLRENRPHDLDYTVGELLDLEERHRDALADVGRAVHAAEAAGVPRGAIKAWLDINGALSQWRAPREEDELQPVVTAIVTSPLGVLVGHRNDEKPPWTFIAGEQEPGERLEDTAIREVKEETGLRIQVGDEIGRRVHPKTGRTMIYMAAAPTHGTEVIVGDEEELAEVRWVSLAEAEELMAAYGMFDAVREYLARELGEG